MSLMTRYAFLGLHPLDRKSTRLNSSHSQISYAVFCLKKKIVRAAIIFASSNKRSLPGWSRLRPDVDQFKKAHYRPVDHEQDSFIGIVADALLWFSGSL